MKKVLLLIPVVIIILTISNIIYGRYVLNKNINIQMNTAPFNFELEANTSEIKINENKAVLEFKIKNNNGSIFNKSDTNYEIYLENTSNFNTSINDENKGTIKGGSSRANTVTINFTPIGESNKLAEDIKLIIKSTYPYKKQISKTITIKNQFIKVGAIEGGKSGTIDCTKVHNYKNLTANNFLLDIEQIVVPEEANGTMNFTKNYNPNTGILTISRDSITGSGIITFYGNIYVTTEATRVDSQSGGYNINIDCTKVDDWKNKMVNNFITDLKWVTIPEDAVGTMTFSKTYDSSTGSLNINRSSIVGNGIITFLVDLYT